MITILGPRWEHYCDRYREERLLRILGIARTTDDVALALVIIAHREHGRRWRLRLDFWDG